MRRLPSQDSETFMSLTRLRYASPRRACCVARVSVFASSFIIITPIVRDPPRILIFRPCHGEFRPARLWGAIFHHAVKIAPQAK